MNRTEKKNWLAKTKSEADVVIVTTADEVRNKHGFVGKVIAGRFEHGINWYCITLDGKKTFWEKAV